LGFLDTPPSAAIFRTADPRAINPHCRIQFPASSYDCNNRAEQDWECARFPFPFSSSLKHLVVGVSNHPRGVMPVSGVFNGTSADYIDMKATVKIEKLPRHSWRDSPPSAGSRPADVCLSSCESAKISASRRPRLDDSYI